MQKTYIGIDNGVTGSIGIISEDSVSFHKTPVRKEKNYTKKISYITRINREELSYLFKKVIANSPTGDASRVMAVIERPVTNRMFKPVISGARSLEATLGVLEDLNIDYQYIDSRAWQKELLPGVKGSANLKTASKATGQRLFPDVTIKTADADGLLIAEYARRMEY